MTWSKKFNISVSFLIDKIGIVFIAPRNCHQKLMALGRRSLTSNSIPLRSLVLYSEIRRDNAIIKTQFSMFIRVSGIALEPCSRRAFLYKRAQTARWGIWNSHWAKKSWWNWRYTIPKTGTLRATWAYWSPDIEINRWRVRFLVKPQRSELGLEVKRS